MEEAIGHVIWLVLCLAENRDNVGELNPLLFCFYWNCFHTITHIKWIKWFQPMTCAALQLASTFRTLFSSRLKSERAKPTIYIQAAVLKWLISKWKICYRGCVIAVSFLLPEQRCHVLACLALIRAAGAIGTEVSATHSSRLCRCEQLEALITAQCASTSPSLPLGARTVCAFVAHWECNRAMTGEITFKITVQWSCISGIYLSFFYLKKIKKTVASCWGFQINGLQLSANACSAKLYMFKKNSSTSCWHCKINLHV